MLRPRSIKEIAERKKAGTQSFDAAVREFIDTWQLMHSEAWLSAIEDEPPPIDPLRDSYLGALAEHLALSEKLQAPAWTEHSSRFLSEPYFAGGLESLKATLLVESPLAFRRRLIFISANALSRPHQPEELIDTNGLQPIN